MSLVVGHPPSPLRLLQLEDNADDAILAVNALEEGGFDVAETRAIGRAQFEACLTGGAEYDLILADFVLPGYDGREALVFARAMRPDIPFIVISGQIGEEHAIEMLKAGATDYVLKQRIKRLVPAVTRALRDRERERVREASEHLIQNLSQRLHERSLLEEVLAQLPAGVLIAEAPGGEVVMANPRFTEIVGVAREALQNVRDLSRSLPLRADGTRYQIAELPCLRALEQGSAIAPEVMRFSAQPPRVAVAHSAPVRDERGRVIAVVTTLTDVTEQFSVEAERNRLRDEVVAERELSRVVIEQMPAGLVLVDAAERVRFANQTARELLGSPLREGSALAETEYDLLAPGSATPISIEQRPVIKALREGAAQRDREYEVRAHAESTRAVLINSAPIRDGAGRTFAAVAVLYDVTERRRLEAELRDQLTLRDRMLSIVSHDLRTPLGTITLSAQGLQRRTSDPQLCRALEVIARSARRMERITRDLLDVGRLRSGAAMTLKREPRDIRPLLETIVEDTTAAFPTMRIVFGVQSGALEAAVDPARIAQALGNLLSNAAQHGDLSSPVRLEAWQSGGEIAISVANQGTPISPDALPHLFEPFRRASGDGGAGHVGLGLFIVEQIVRAHGGRVEARSSADAGTRITMFLPALEQERASSELPQHA